MAKFFDGIEEAMEHVSGAGAFLTAKSTDGTVNTMTIGWGYIGYSWNKPFFVAMVRKSRYTSDIISHAGSFTVSIPFDENMREKLVICGTTSGRDVDKEEEAGITFLPARIVDTPVIDGCDRYYECNIAYSDLIELDKLPASLVQTWYPDGDCHDVFYGEIVDTYTGS